MSEQTLRVAFVGQSVYFEQCSLLAPAGGLEPTYIDFRAGAAPAPLSSALHELDPDVILVFRPEIIPEGLFDSLRAVTVGYLTEPLPRSGGRGHPDLEGRLWWLEQVDTGNFDRVVSFDPLIAETAANVIPVWRSLALPVADDIYAEPRELSRPPSILFIGRSTEHREELLAPAKAAHRIIHIAHGLHGQRLRRMLAATDVQINLHNNPYPSFENRVCIALAAGQLVISEPLSPLNGLVPGRDFLQIEDGQELAGVLGRLAADPGAYEQIRRDGRAAAEQFRASAVYPRLLREAIADVAAAGTARRRTVAA